ncbi:MAG: hypothetical protein AVO34_11035 [Firmicutes bacterium ML8_F2]|jgi:hypothetical protein|nr:MAG: hypothetical protein AVO34_11035 [Firmicutes bacterium ML8_F2]
MAEEWTILMEAANDIEADIICGFLEDKGIPARKADSSPYSGAMRIIGGSAVEVQVLVPHSFLKQAEKVIRDFNKPGKGS